MENRLLALWTDARALAVLATEAVIVGALKVSVGVAQFVHRELRR
jgi:hypothetical protein